MKKAYVLLSGCGSRDGSEIHESTLCLLALDLYGISYQCIAPDIQQASVVNHLKSTPENIPRNAIAEAARIARGNIITIPESSLDADLLVIPGGIGAATTLCTYAKNKENATILPEVQKLILSFYQAKKTIVATCIAPALVALSLRSVASISLTLGMDADDMEWLKKIGMDPVLCTSERHVVDTANRIITTPAYMNTTTIGLMWHGIEGAIRSATSLM